MIFRMLFNLEMVWWIDRPLALYLSYGGGWTHGQEVMDPDLHTPSLAFITEDME